jgi:hypothetical protein
MTILYNPREASRTWRILLQAFLTVFLRGVHGELAIS